MKARHLFAALMVLAALGLAGCGGAYVPTVYTAGNYYTTKYVPCYWTGTDKTDLEIPADAIASAAKSIFVSSGVVYTAGNYMNSSSKYVACYWKGTECTALSNGTTNAYATSIVVDNDGTVFVAGYYENASSYDIACYWTHSDATGTDGQDLNSSEAVDAYADSIVLSGSTVYIAGVQNGNACYWKDSLTDTDGATKVDLSTTSSDSSRAFAIAVSDAGTVYAAGYYETSTPADMACYWEDTDTTDATSPDPIDLPAGSSTSAIAYAIALSGSTVYTAGRYIDGNEIACYWTGSDKTDLTTTSEIAYVNSLFVLDGTVYSAGCTSDNGKGYALYPCYWAGTSKTMISDIDSANAYGIYVQ